MVSAWHVDGTRGSGIVFSAAHVLWMSVVRGMRGVGAVCVWLEGGEWMRGLGLSFTNPVGTGGVGRVLGPGAGGVVLCLCEL